MSKGICTVQQEGKTKNYIFFLHMSKKSCTFAAKLGNMAFKERIALKYLPVSLKNNINCRDKPTQTAVQTKIQYDRNTRNDCHHNE